ncbi:MAG TPA: hypothetical protein VLS89_13085 [Candidatus Nanopelagicales bacterium]|nr:hypothetical protein [Candidatus Nanopelagicales bacterium]
MLCFLRLASQDAFCGEVDEERRAKARKVFTLRETEAGVSVYQASSDDEQRLTVAAIACRRFVEKPSDPREKPVDLLPVAAEVIARFGSVVTTSGTTPIPRANALHRELQWSQERLWALADEVFSSRLRVRRFDRNHVRATLGGLNPAEVEAGQPEVLAWLARFR